MSVTPLTASIPQSAFDSAAFSRSRVVGLSTSMPSSSFELAVLPRRTVSVAAAATTIPSPGDSSPAVPSRTVFSATTLPAPARTRMFAPFAPRTSFPVTRLPAPSTEIP